jgi:hypothetical protein
MSSAIINKIPGIKGLRYLEIGVLNGDTFNAVNAGYKVGVDIEHEATFKGSSDDFFAQNKETFDVCYIDGDHSKDQVIKDFNNAIKVVKKLIIMHDMFPQPRVIARLTTAMTLIRCFITCTSMVIILTSAATSLEQRSYTRSSRRSVTSRMCLTMSY